MKEVRVTGDLDADFVCLFPWHSFPIVIFLHRNFFQWVPATCSMLQPTGWLIVVVLRMGTVHTCRHSVYYHQWW